MKMPDQEKSGCAGCLELLSAYIDDELGSGELVEMSAHLRECSRCARQLEEMMAVKNALVRAEPFWLKPAPKDFFARALRDKLAAQDPWIHAGGPGPAASRRSRLKAGLARWSAGAVLVGLLFTGAVYYLDQGRREPTSAGLAGGQSSSARTYLVAQRDTDVEGYLRDHVLESAGQSLLDEDDSVEFVDHEAP